MTTGFESLDSTKFTLFTLFNLARSMVLCPTSVLTLRQAWPSSAWRGIMEHAV
jgi:hypothetical protein